MEDEIRFHLEFEHNRKPNTPRIRRGTKASTEDDTESPAHAK